MSPVLVPVVELGLGTGTAAVRDERSGRAVRLDRPPLVLVGAVVHARGTALDRDGRLSLVRFGSAREVAWCRAVPDLTPAAVA